MARIQPIPIPMEDPIIHTPDYPICDDPDCICYALELEQAEEAERNAMFPRTRRHTLVSSQPTDISAPLNGNRGFSLLR